MSRTIPSYTIREFKNYLIKHHSNQESVLKRFNAVLPELNKQSGKKLFKHQIDFVLFGNESLKAGASLLVGDTNDRHKIQLPEGHMNENLYDNPILKRQLTPQPSNNDSDVSDTLPYIQNPRRHVSRRQSTPQPSNNDSDVSDTLPYIQNPRRHVSRDNAAMTHSPSSENVKQSRIVPETNNDESTPETNNDDSTPETNNDDSTPETNNNRTTENTVNLNTDSLFQRNILRKIHPFIRHLDVCKQYFTIKRLIDQLSLVIKPYKKKMNDYLKFQKGKNGQYNLKHPDLVQQDHNTSEFILRFDDNTQYELHKTTEHVSTEYYADKTRFKSYAEKYFDQNKNNKNQIKVPAKFTPFVNTRGRTEGLFVLQKNVRPKLNVLEKPNTRITDDEILDLFKATE